MHKLIIVNIYCNVREWNSPARLNTMKTLKFIYFILNLNYTSTTVNVVLKIYRINIMRIKLFVIIEYSLYTLNKYYLGYANEYSAKIVFRIFLEY